MPVEPVDDGEVLYRRFTVVQADKSGKATSFAFCPRKDEEDGLSTLAASLVSQDQCLEGHADLGLASLTAGDARACDCNVVRDKHDPRHVLIQIPGGSKQVQRTRSKLALRATTIRVPGAMASQLAAQASSDPVYAPTTKTANKVIRLHPLRFTALAVAAILLWSFVRVDERTSEAEVWGNPALLIITIALVVFGALTRRAH